VTALDTCTPLYPVTYGGFPACTECFQRTRDLGTCADPRDGELRRLCAACHRALCAGRPPALPTGDTLAETWERLARQHHNEEIDSDLIRRALSRLASSLTVEYRDTAYLQLSGAYDQLAYARSDRFDPARGDREDLELLALDDAKNAIRKLTGARP
jgi:hypothetical protein